MNSTDNIDILAGNLVGELIEAGKTLATAESCTGGWIAKALTDVAGSSHCFGYGIVSYSDAAKQSLLAVKSATLQAHGAVSEMVVEEMAHEGNPQFVGQLGNGFVDKGIEVIPFDRALLGLRLRKAFLPFPAAFVASEPVERAIGRDSV